MSVRSTSIPPRITWASLEGKPASFSPSAHTHPIADVTGLQSALDGKQAAGSYLTSSSLTWANLSGKPTTFTPSAHTHSYNDLTDKPVIPPTAGRLEFIGNLNVTETLLLSLSLGMKRKVFPLAGVLASDRLQFSPTAVGTAGCEVVNILPSGAGSVNVGYYVPALGIGATYTMPIAVYRVTT